MTGHADRSIEQALGRPAPPAPEAWQRIRGELARRAGAEGLVDVAFERHESPLGTLVIGATPEGLVRVGLPSEAESDVLHELAERISPRVLHASSASLRQIRAELDEYFGGRRRAFGVPLDWRLTAGFRRDVLRATAAIPFGETASYRDVATSAGRARAVRAAGTALAVNPLPIVVPCHRVVRSDGALGSYRGGSAAKDALLRLEGAQR
jgi:methylated-DNA-[protein]-cysteine S-methyltransferase